MQILNRIEQFFFPCTQALKDAHQDNKKAVREAVCAIREAGEACSKIINK